MKIRIEDRRDRETNPCRLLKWARRKRLKWSFRTFINEREVRKYGEVKSIKSGSNYSVRNYDLLKITINIIIKLIS